MLSGPPGPDLPPPCRELLSVTAYAKPFELGCDDHSGAHLCVHVERAVTPVKTASLVLAVPAPCRASEEEKLRPRSLACRWVGLTALTGRARD